MPSFWEGFSGKSMDHFLVFSVTIKSAAADGDSMIHFLVFSVTMRSASLDGDSMDYFLVFSVTMRSASVDGDSMDHFVVFSATMRSAAADGDNTDHFLVFSVCVCVFVLRCDLHICVVVSAAMSICAIQDCQTTIYNIYNTLMSPLYFWQRLTCECARSPRCGHGHPHLVHYIIPLERYYIKTLGWCTVFSVHHFIMACKLLWALWQSACVYI